MAEDKLTFLTEVELPPYCFISEAIEWIAFGRVPHMQHESDRYTDEIIDARFYWREMPDNFQPQFEHPWFDRLEFESLGIPITETYFKAADECLFESVADLPTRIAEYEANGSTIIEREDGTTFDLNAKMLADARATLARLGPMQQLVDEVELLFKQHAEVAYAKLFQLLAVGEIACEALSLERWERLYDDGKYQDAARFDKVPTTAISLNLDWTKNEIKINGKQHVALRVSTKDILDHRSMLLQPGKPISVERFGAFYSSSNRGRTIRAAKRGRRSVVDWPHLKIRLRELASAGELPEGKENCIYELIAIAERELGKGPSRTAVQRNLGPELDALYARH